MKKVLAILLALVMVLALAACAAKPATAALCAATTAAMGAAAGMAWLVDGRYETISYSAFPFWLPEICDRIAMPCGSTTA